MRKGYYRFYLTNTAG